jgi:hypothetical protein
MDQITTVGIDLAKSVFQVHGIDATGAVLLQRRLRPRSCDRIFRQAPALPRRAGSLGSGAGQQACPHRLGSARSRARL